MANSWPVFFKLNDKNPSPPNTMYDGVDYVPAPALVLFGHHFSSISGAGPVIGPIIQLLPAAQLLNKLRKKLMSCQ